MVICLLLANDAERLASVCLPFWAIGGFGPHWFKPWSSHANDFKIYTCRFLARCLVLLG